MNIIIPMAGMGKRMRPHTLKTPKPLLPIAGKPIAHRLVESLAKSTAEKLDEIAFIIGRFGQEVEDNLLSIAEKVGAQGKIYYQDEPLGTAHAVYCAKESMNGPVIIAFADTLFTADFKLDTEQDGIIWVKQIEDPSSFGVVMLDDQGYIKSYHEKPQTFISDLAMIGIYYFKDGIRLKNEIEWLLQNDQIKSGEYQLPDAFERMTLSGYRFKTGKVHEWLDFGNKDVTVSSHARILSLDSEMKKTLISGEATLENSTIIQPVYIEDGVVIKNSVIGPYVSISANTSIENSVIRNSIIYRNSKLSTVVLNNSMIGNFVNIADEPQEISIGDYSKNN